MIVIFSVVVQHMDHELSYGGNNSLHTHDFMDLCEYLRESPAGGGDVLGSSSPQTPGVNHQHGLGPRVRVVRRCGTGGRLGHPGQRH